MNKRLLLLFTATVCTFITLYIPQPLQPYLAALYGRSTAEGGALMTLALLPLAIAPIFYGYLLGNIHPTALLRYALIALALSNILFASVHGFEWLLVIRFIQGALIPILITAFISLLLHDNDRVQQTLSLYIGFTILGGFLGRFLSGLFDTWFIWQAYPWLIAIILFGCALALPNGQTAQNQGVYQRPQLLDFVNMLRQRRVFTYYVVIFAFFSCFVALLNYLPFILKQAFPESTSLTAGLMYSGFITGAGIAVMADRIVKRFGLQRSLISAGVLFIAAIVALFVSGIVLTFCVLFIFCAAMFLLHSVAIAEVNKHSRYSKALTNAFYTTFYYAGGVYGSSVPGIIYQHFGLEVFLSLLIFTALIGLIALISLGYEV